MRSRLENNTLFDPLFAQGFRLNTEVLGITSTFTVTSTFPTPPIIALNPHDTAGISVYLPPISGATLAMEGRQYTFYNTTSGSGSLAIKSDTADTSTTVVTLSGSEQATVTVINGVWTVFYLGSNASPSVLAMTVTSTFKGGTSTGSLVGFYGATPVVQPTNANQAAVTSTAVNSTIPAPTSVQSAAGNTGSCFGFISVAQASSVLNAVASLIGIVNSLTVWQNTVRADLVALGLEKGS